ncbi:uncharacterized protein LOC118434144 [Folsomia candida]|nr:uncharacterized protein LOC118434144 [Folsomia candida]
MKIIVIDNNISVNSQNSESVGDLTVDQAEAVVILQPLFDIKSIILKSDEEKGTTKGKQLLEEIGETNVINYRIKTVIKRRIVNYLVKQYSYYPSKHEKQNLAECVASQLFQNLSNQQQKDIMNLFYSPSTVIISNSTGSSVRKRIPASGLIEERLRHLRKKYSVGLSINVVSSSSESYAPSEDDEGKKSWLAYSSSPQSQVLEYMAQTYPMRTAEIRNTKDISVTLSQWPRLLETVGMIDQDFSFRHPEKNELMLRNWTQIGQQIWQAAKNTKLDVTNELGVEQHINNWTTDQVNNGSLILLPYLLSNSAYTRSGKKRRRITGGQSSYFFLQFVNATEDLEAFRLSELTRKQPFVLCVGNLKTLTIQQAYIMVERRLIAAETLVKAVDTCFKIFHVLQLQFPEECYGVWSFFDHSVFKINEITAPPSCVLSLSSQIIF